MKTKEERLAALDWEHPDWEFLYHCLLYEIKPHNIVDKRTHKEAHEQAVREAKVLRALLDAQFKDLVKRYGNKGALEKIREILEEEGQVK